MNLDKTLRVLNEMQSQGVIGPYAIGGAVASFLYLEPGATFDLDVFILWETGPRGLVDLSPINNYLTKTGHRPGREGMMIEGWEVQFLPVNTALEREALTQALPIEIAGVATSILTREHLMAICLQVGRAKDFARLLQFVQEGQLDKERFAEILRTHSLEKKWTDFKRRFIESK